MTNAEFITIELPNDRTEELAIVANENGSFTSMPKAVYDAQVTQATLVTESAPTA